MDSSAYDLMEEVDCDVQAVAIVIYSFGTLVNIVVVMQARLAALVTERIVDSVEAEVSVRSFYSVD